MQDPAREIPDPRRDRDVYTVSRLNREARALLERGFGGLWLEGEISNFARPGSGHWYFSLKDAAAQVRCAMFRTRNSQLRFTPRDGQKVLVRARVGLYEPRGEYQLLIEHLEDAGIGALKRQFEELAARLSAEGLFETARKRPLPRLPRRIGVITSPTGAAVRDILQVLGRRFPAAAVLIYPVPVQGAQAPAEIVEALRLAGRRAECDVLILARGGGSLEDLWAFNDEAVARAIVASPIPVVSGVGHEVDFTIADFAADLRAPTPSAAAEIVVPDAEEWSKTFRAFASRLRQSMSRWLRDARDRLGWLAGRTAHAGPSARLAEQMQRLDELEQRLPRGVRQRLAELRSAVAESRSRLWSLSPAVRLRETAGRQNDLLARLRAAELQQLRHARERLLPLVRTLQAVSPLATLERGYAIVATGDGRILRDAADAPPGTRIEARLARGRIRATVDDPPA
ncbi:MAG TPA: exodeoxyribonuclease VII large subunit [Steroidobacteraceae bacterium]|nr:exodeoxyribonuclease VII large subunit [Steroidobacteraceae bacterium]